MQNRITITDKMRFSRVNKEMLDDPTISFKAKGILAYLLGKPPNWKLRVKDLMNHSTDGRDSIRSSLKELQSAGYAKYHQQRNKGIFEEGVWQINDSRLFQDSSKSCDKNFYKYWDDYNDYLRSNHWRNLKVKKFKSVSLKCCEECGSKDNLQVHHLSYDNFPDCPLENLRILCEDCHKAEHGIV